MSRGGTLVVVVALLALAWLNSPWGASYFQVWHTPLTVSFGGTTLAKPLLFWVNHALMALFFLVITLELKRLFRTGELAAFRTAAFPVAAALGGMAVSAGLYLYMNEGLSSERGWTVPMATDVTAALAVLAVFGQRLSLSLRLFLSAVTILQTILALLLTIVLYTSIANLLSLSVGTGIFGLLVVLRALRNRSMWLYLLLGLAMWGAFLVAGVNGAVAGVLLALVIPVHARVDEEDFITSADTVLGELHALKMVKFPGPGEELEEEYQATVHTLRANCNRALSPLRKLLHQLLPWAAYAVLPLFALANAAFAYNSFELQELGSPVALGIFLGLVLGKPLGVLLFAGLATLVRLTDKPTDVSWLQVAGAGMLAGIGFTMSLFMALEVWGESQPMTILKISLYGASALAAILGAILVAFSNRASR